MDLWFNRLIGLGSLTVALLAGGTSIAEENGPNSHLKGEEWRYGVLGEKANNTFEEAVEDVDRLETPDNASFSNRPECSKEVLESLRSKNYSFVSPTAHYENWNSSENRFIHVCKKSDVELNENWILPSPDEYKFPRNNWESLGGAHYVADHSVDIYEIKDRTEKYETYFVTIGEGLLAHLSKNQRTFDSFFKIVRKKDGKCRGELSNPLSGSAGIVDISGNIYYFNISDATSYSEFQFGKLYRKSFILTNIETLKARKSHGCTFMMPQFHLGVESPEVHVAFPPEHG